MAKARRRNAAAKAPSAIALLIEDHDYVKQAYRDFQKMDHEDHEAVQGLVKNVCAALEMHTRLEEEIFYPRCAGRSTTRT